MGNSLLPFNLHNIISQGLPYNFLGSSILPAAGNVAGLSQGSSTAWRLSCTSASISCVRMKQPLGICVDESTYVTVTEHLAVIVKMWGPDQKQVVTAMLNLLGLERATPEGLFRAIAEELRLDGLSCWVCI